MKNRNITKDLLFVIFIVVLGKIIGFARELIVAYLFGSSAITDAFYFANGLTTSLLSIITMGLAQAFTPVYLDLQIKRGQNEARSFANKITLILLSIGIVVCVFMAVFPDLFVAAFGGFELEDGTNSMASEMLRILSFCIPVYIAFSIRKCILNAHEKYKVTEASGIPYSIAICLLTYFLYRTLNGFSLPVAALVGYILQFLLVFAFSLKQHKFRFTQFSFSDPLIKDYFKMLAPIAVCAILEEANGLLRKSLAGGLGEGAIANLSYCMTLTTLINGIVITSISTVYFPNLIKMYSENKGEEFEKCILDCLNMASFLVIPVVALLTICSKDVVSAIYERGSFTEKDTLAVSSLFSIYVIGSIMFAYRTIIRTSFYSAKDAKSPMINEIIYLIICMVANILQVKVFKFGLEALGIAWVVSISIMTPVLFLQFRKKHFSLLKKPFLLETLKCVFGALVAVGLVFILKAVLPITNKYLRVIAYLGGGAVVYLLMLFLLRSSTIKQISNIFKKGENVNG